MSLACKILTSFLLIFILSAQETDIVEVKGVLNHHITLDFADQKHDDVDDIQWFKSDDRIARVRAGNVRDQQKGYQVSVNGTLTIKHLQRSDHSSFKIVIYNKVGHQIFTRTFHLSVLERVSKPEISWNCTNTTLICKVTNGTNPKLKLYQGKRYIKEGQKVILYKWTAKQNTSFKCTANNTINEETSVVDLTCPEKSLDIFLIIGICGGGVLFLLFVALFILLHISRRRKVHRRRNDEELEIRAHKMTSEERHQKPHQIPASALQNPATSQPPPPPGHRPKAHGHRPPPPGHRVQHPHQNQQQKRPLAPPGTQTRQQKGPPLPRPRVQPKPPRGASENS